MKVMRARLSTGRINLFKTMKEDETETNNTNEILELLRKYFL